MNLSRTSTTTEATLPQCSFDVQDVDDCAELCVAHLECRFYTFSSWNNFHQSHICYLKANGDGIKYSEGEIREHAPLP